MIDYKQIDIYKDRCTVRQTELQCDKQMDSWTAKQRDRQTER